MKAFISIVLTVVFCAGMSVSSHAQMPSDPQAREAARDFFLYPNAPRANPQFEFMAREALERMPERFDFDRLRSLYAETRQYDPIGEDTLEILNTYAYRVFNDKDPKTRQKALILYQDTVVKHLANMGVVMQALSYARQDKRFGKVHFFQWLQAGLMKSVMLSRNGKTLADAYSVATLSEETALIHTLGLKFLKAIPVQEGRIYYNMNEVQDFKTGQKWTLFVNTSIPMRFLEKLKEEHNRYEFEIKRQ